MPAFSGADLQHGLAVGLLQVLQLPLVLLTYVFRLGPQGVLHAAFAGFNPDLDFRRGQVELAARCRHRGLAMDDLKDQR